MIAFLLALASPAEAADVTWTPERLHGAAGVRYDGSYTWGWLSEDDGIDADVDPTPDDVVSGRRITEHNVDLGIQFTPIDGITAVIDLSLSPSWLWRYPDAKQMLIEPVEGGGSYVFADSPDPAADPVDVRGGGINGVWLGLALSPFNERFQQNHKVTWRLDAAFRPGRPNNNRWVLDEGSRGGSPGGTALRLSGAFSRRGGSAEPYVRGRFQQEGRVEVELASPDGTAATVELRPASHVELLGGTEVLASQRTEVETAIDFHLGFRYFTWEDLPSGMLLPNVIDAGKTIAVTRSERVQGLAGMGLNLRFSDVVRTSTGARFQYTVPHRLEHIYDVRTSPDTFGVAWYFSITGTLGPDELGAN